MSLRSRHFALALIAVAAIAVAPVAAAYPASAGATVNDLESEGYIVHINWVNGKTQQLEDCWVTGVNIPGDSPESRTTAYVDVKCPNDLY